MLEINLNDTIEQYPRIHKKLVSPLKHLGVRTILDLLYHLPFRYEDFSHISKICNVEPGHTYTISGAISSVKNVYMRYNRMTMTEAIIEDDSGSIKAVWFNQPYLTKTLTKGLTGNFAGKIVAWKKGLSLQNPAHEIITRQDGFEKEVLIHTGRIVPIYPSTSGISTRWLRYLIFPLLEHSSQINDALPKSIQESQKLMKLSEALKQIHFPENSRIAKEAKKRLAFEDLFILHLSHLTAKHDLKKQIAPNIPFDEAAAKNFVACLPFKLTGAQRKSAWEIIKDMRRNEPMNRLLEGDVGSGKTVVAAIAALNTAHNKLQTVFMAPTEILAVQHFETLSRLFSKQDITLGLLTANASKMFYGISERKETISKKGLKTLVAEGDINIIVGTHALIQKDVSFHSLGFIIVDEQHRFGVEQRAQLAKRHKEHKEGGKHSFEVPHFLSMTATPIPRTLALAVYGDLEISIIDELPPGRQKIITKIVIQNHRAEVYAFIRKEIESGRQAFVICPRIETTKVKDDEVIRLTPRALSMQEVKTVKEEYEKLSKKIFPDISVGMLHGKMKPKEKEEIMRGFANNEIKVLISTSVVEVGVDIPNATIMMIEGADMFGLAQMHQFRGRVGRGAHQSYCLLFSDSPFMSGNQRLKAMVDTQNGFELAKKDLEIRGPGDFMGIRQSGFPDLIMDSLGDTILIKNSREEAQKLMEKDPELIKHPLLKEKLAHFIKQAHLE